MSAHSSIYVGENTHFVEVRDLKDADGHIQTEATVTLVDITLKGVSVSGVTFPIPLAHVEEGKYRAVIPDGGEFQAGEVYEATVLAIGPQGYKAQWSERLVAKVRRA